MSPLEDNLSGITRIVLERIENNLLFTKYVNREYDGRLGNTGPRKPLSRYVQWGIEARWYLRNLGSAWLDAIKALAGKDPHEHCDEDY